MDLREDVPYDVPPDRRDTSWHATILGCVLILATAFTICFGLWVMSGR